MCIGSNSVNQAQDLITVTKFEDFPNSLLPNKHSCIIFAVCRIECDIDGWILKVNNEISYDTYYHIEDLNIEDIQSVKIMGDVAISYTGFGSKGNMFLSW